MGKTPFPWKPFLSKKFYSKAFPDLLPGLITEGLKLHLVLKTVTLPSSKSGKKLKLEVSYQTNLQYSSLPLQFNTLLGFH